MADTDNPALQPMTADERRVASGQFDRANQVIATGNFDYGIQLLLTCCRLDPGNLTYRQTLRQTVRTKYKNNQHGSRFAVVTSARSRLRLRNALRAGEYLKALEHGEEVLLCNPWDVGALMGMAQAFDQLGLINPAVWSLEQARQVDPKSLKVLRAMARVCEKRGNFTQAALLWEQVRKGDPKDVEAQRKAKDLAANETIARGRYEEAVTGTAEQCTDATAEHPRPAGDKPGLKTKSPAPAPVDRVVREATGLRSKLAADPTNANLYLQLAGVYRRADQLDQARQVLEEGLGPTGNHFELALELADLNTEAFRADLTIAEQQLRARPDDPDLRALRQRLLKEINARELDLYRQKADRHPTDMAWRFEVGVRLLKAGQVDEAIRELQAARTDPRHHWRALMYLGYCFKSRNNWRLAQRNFEEALKGMPAAEEATRKELLYQLAHGHAGAGEFAKAVEVAYELANLDFGYKDIGRTLDEWQARIEGSRQTK